ncbi:MAG: YceK/YidQ family lipoprotein, partial [Victivallales bacterium]|nr:YceK/YidQ family lipoprotein [Victivallales bacterium]
MRPGQRWVLAGLAATMLLANGCALTYTRSKKWRTPPPVYNATIHDVVFLVMGTGDVGEKIWDVAPPLAPAAVVVMPLFVADGAVSLAADTAMLPYDMYHRGRHDSDTQFWRAAFSDKEPLPTVKEMHQHVTRYSVYTVMDMLGRELGGDRWMNSGRHGRTPEQQRARQEARTRRRSARLDRLIEAEIALAGVAARPDLSPVQIERVLPYARKQRAVQLALLANPATPPKIVDELSAVPDSDILQALARNPAFSPQRFGRLARGADPETLAILASNRFLPQPLLAQLVQTATADTLSRLAKQQDLSDACARQLARRPEAMPQLVLHGRDNLPADVLATALATAYDARLGSQLLHKAIRRQRHAPVSILQEAWQQGSLMPDDLPKLANTSPEARDWAARRLAAHGEFRPDLIKELLPELGTAPL